MNDRTVITLPKPRSRRKRSVNVGFTHFAQGEPMIWITGGALALLLAMIAVMLIYVLLMGASTFWPRAINRVETLTGQVYLGEVTRKESFTPGTTAWAGLSEDEAQQVRSRLAEQNGAVARRLYRTGNYDLTGTRFHWIPDYILQSRSYPQWAMMFERMEWGPLYGFPSRFILDDEVVADEPDAVWEKFKEHHPQVRQRWRERRNLETYEIGRANRTAEEARLTLAVARQRHLAGHISDKELDAAQAQYDAVLVRTQKNHAVMTNAIAALDEENRRAVMVVETIDGKSVRIHLADVVRAYPANQLGFFDKLGVYGSRWREFLFEEPREANMEGGIYPAIIGTVIMTLVMTVCVVPFGVLAALYLREYAKPGLLVSSIRIAINNLAGVPSIVFGVFGLGFFCYIVGGFIDEWFFSARLPSPTFRKGGVFWASLTLALLTLPVVIVATEEALAAVSGSMREGSYACGASKWQTIRRIILPRAMPGIMTGMILAMARGAGEVAPLMLVGAVKLAPDLPLDLHNWSGAFGPIPTGPIHLERSFMHLGFHIYDVGFQSPDSEAARPMVFTTTLLLISIIVLLNLAAMWLRARLRRKFAGSQF